MTESATARESVRMSRAERATAGALGALLLLAAVWLVVRPPGRRVALQGCTAATSGCVVTVDGDLASWAAGVAALGVIVVLVAVMGLKPESVRVWDNTVNFWTAARGYAVATSEDLSAGKAAESPDRAPEGGPDPVAPAPERAPADPTSSFPAGSGGPIEVAVERGHGAAEFPVPIAVARLAVPMKDVDHELLRSYQTARNRSQHRHFLTHILGPATQRGQKYSVAIRVTPRRDSTERVVAADFFLGRAWGYRIFPGSRGADGNFGITTEAYGEFLVLCQVTFDDGESILLDHYCDFEMGDLLRTQ